MEDPIAEYTGDILIQSGENEKAIYTRYGGERTERALKARLEKESRGGLKYVAVWTANADKKQIENSPRREKNIYIKLNETFDDATDIKVIYENNIIRDN